MAGVVIPWTHAGVLLALTHGQPVPHRELAKHGRAEIAAGKTRRVSGGTNEAPDGLVLGVVPWLDMEARLRHERAELGMVSAATLVLWLAWYRAEIERGCEPRCSVLGLVRRVAMVATGGQVTPAAWDRGVLVVLGCCIGAELDSGEG